MAAFNDRVERIRGGLFYETGGRAHEFFDELFSFHRSKSFFALLGVLHDVVVVVDRDNDNVGLRFYRTLFEVEVSSFVMEVDDEERDIVLLVEFFHGSLVNRAVYRTVS